MATSISTPLSEYLSTVYEPDCDYVDGEVQERNLGEEEHSDLQGQILELLRTPFNKEYVRVNPEIRVQVSATRYRVPDIYVRRRAIAKERIVRQPALLCIEILSPEDRMSRMREKIRDYFEMSVLEVWVVDPGERAILVCTPGSMTEKKDGQLSIPETPISLSISDIFSALDDY